MTAASRALADGSVGRALWRRLDLETGELVAARRGCPVGDVMVVVLDCPRHEDGIAAISTGARGREHRTEPNRHNSLVQPG